MRKSLHEIREIDQYIQKKMLGADRLVFQAKVLLSPSLAEDVRNQSRVYQCIKWFARERKSEQLQSIYNNLTEDKNFKNEIERIFA